MAHWRNYLEVAKTGQHTVAGTLKVLPALRSPQLGNRRDLLVWLPPSYGQGDARYAVLYVHDGQNLFDEATSYAGEWQVDETMQALSQEGVQAIVVGIPNAGEQRPCEYSPFADWPEQDGRGEAYLAFVVDTVKPLIDRDFRTLADRAHTGIMGSSLGGLISLFAFFHCAQVFGLAGAISPAFEPTPQEMLGYVEQAPFVPGRVYMDVGTREAASGPRQTREEQAESRAYLASVRQMRDVLLRKGYRRGTDLCYLQERGGIHHESAWARRLPGAIKFLLG